MRNKFLQLIPFSLDSASLELHQYARRMCGPMKNPEVETRSRASNSGPHDCKADALPHDHGHHKDKELKDKEQYLILVCTLHYYSIIFGGRNFRPVSLIQFARDKGK